MHSISTSKVGFNGTLYSSNWSDSIISETRLLYARLWSGAVPGSPNGWTDLVFDIGSGAL